jgi:hypothetical protein
MLPYTIDNHFTFGYGKDTFNILDASPNLDFWCNYSRAKYIPDSFKEECIKTAISLSDSAKALGRKPVILLSGGMDSHVVVKSFIEAGLEFQTVTNRFFRNLNDHELVYVEKLKEEYKFPHKYINLDVEKFLQSNEAAVMAEESLCAYPQMFSTMKLMKYVWDNGGMPILGNGDFYAIRSINPKWRLQDFNAPKYMWEYVEYEYILAWFRYAIKHKIVGGLGFFQHNAEIVLAMGLEEHIVNTVTGADEGKQSTRSSKYEVYKKYWPEFENRQKYHGGEKISGLCDMLRKTTLLPQHGNYERKWTMDYFKFIDLLMPND